MKTLITPWKIILGADILITRYRRNIITGKTSLIDLGAGEIIRNHSGHYNCRVWENDDVASGMEIPIPMGSKIESVQLRIDKILIQMGYYINDSCMVMS